MQARTKMFFPLTWGQTKTVLVPALGGDEDTIRMVERLSYFFKVQLFSQYAGAPAFWCQAHNGAVMHAMGQPERFEAELLPIKWFSGTALVSVEALNLIANYRTMYYLARQSRGEEARALLHNATLLVEIIDNHPERAEIHLFLG
ncbi:hypothetical protein IT774_05080 [Salinimonas marina]|uniref:Antirestriction protein n=1 Tax=Salinimonas marina TaxID=2785918 RepID=A0A7S9HE26_9ALTE|nr:hypothetical protein [Salinimonas marina]QPG06547.1 hypothetical protein IT774_05080 [Salinimonas marina]